jgi:hypothetical protein
VSRVAWLSIALVALACRGREAARLREGNAAAAHGSLVEAEHHFAEGASGATTARAAVLHGNALWALEQRAAAAAEWQRAQQLDPGDRSARVGLATAALEARDAGAALALLGSSEAPLLRARALLLRGGEGDAQAAVDELAAAPSAPDQQFLTGSALTMLRRFADAQAVFDRLSVAPGGAFSGRYGLARLAAAQGRPTDALLHLGAARAAAPQEWSGEAVKLDPAFAFLADSGEFRALVAQNNVSPALPPK